ncbi:MAG: hypothetical protein JXX28_00680 [Deltaproteobacteria bacterium]|nr:hypothetical protein [Deltaproteobacteria bacterium]
MGWRRVREGGAVALGVRTGTHLSDLFLLGTGALLASVALLELASALAEGWGS